MEVLLPLLAFAAVLATVLLLGHRPQARLLRLDRHEIAGVGSAAVPPPVRVSILGAGPNIGRLGALVARITRGEVKTKAVTLLLQAGSPMTLGRFLLMRAIFMFVLTPLFMLYVFKAMGLSFVGIAMMAGAAFTLPQLPMLRIKRKARPRAAAIDSAMPDALDLLVVCVEGGLSLDGALLQVAQRTEGVLAAELRRLQRDMQAGMGRRDAFLALAERSQSESLGVVCSTIVQADKMGMSIATTLRTLAETMRTRRRQRAEMQARKAPIKMMPALIFFMIPALFIVILGPALLSMLAIL